MITSEEVSKEFTQIWHKDLNKVHIKRLTEIDIPNTEYSESKTMSFWERKTYGRPMFPVALIQVQYHPTGEYANVFIRAEAGMAGVLRIVFNGEIRSVTELRMITDLLGRSNKGLRK